MSNEQKMELKTIALTQRIAEIVSEYEGRVADLRVELTMTTRERDALSQENTNLKMQVEQTREDAVVEEESPAGDDS